jgi:hypothetical protein
MALTPGLYVPQGQVGTGAAYVHEIKDRSGYLEAVAKAAEKQRVNQEKQIAKLKGFDYGKVVDENMKKHISQKYKEGLETFSRIVAAGGEIDNISTEEGIQYTTWQNQIKDEADTAALAETKKQEFRNKVDNPQYGVDPEMVYTVMQDYDNAQTPDEKLAATQSFDPTLLRDFPYNDWINEEIDDAEKDREITELGEDKTKYQEVFKEKLKEIPALLASKDGYKIAKKQWEIRHNKGEVGFQQASFADFLDEKIEAERIIREKKTESPAAKGNNITVVLPGETPKNAVITPTSNVQGMAINIPDLKESFEGKSPNHQAFWVADPSRNIPRLILKGKGGDPAAYGVDGVVAMPDPEDENNGIAIKGDMLWKFRIPTQGQVFMPQDKAELSTKFKDANYFDENSKVTGGEPADMYQDQLGNLWLDLTDENGGLRHIIVAVGGYTQTYKDRYGNVSENPLKSVAEKNQAAIEKSLGVKFSDFANKYFYNNMNITK